MAAIFLNENFLISNEILPKFVSNGPIDNNSALNQIMAWHWVNIGSSNDLLPAGTKPLPEPMLQVLTIIKGALWCLP